MSRSYHTPEFLRWSLDRACALRPVDKNDDPEWVDRHVRGIRAAGEAIALGRVIDGIALEPSACDPKTAPSSPAGFVLDEVLSLYGGRDAIAAQCDGCPANADRSTESPAWAGCFGLIEWDSLDVDFLARAEQLAEALPADLFLPTRPRWHGVWATDDWTRERLSAAGQWLDAIRENVSGAAPLFHGLRAAVTAAQMAGVPAADVPAADTAPRPRLRTRLFPAGHVAGTVWTVFAHCRRCGATRAEASVPCPVCGLRGGVTAARQRGVRGSRPFGPLERFLGAGPARELLERYWSRALPGSAGRVS